MATDINIGSLPAVLPYVRENLGLTYQATGGIMFSYAMMSAVTQPIFGLLADRFDKPWLLPFGVLLAGAGLGMLFLAQGYATVLFFVAITGLGVAIYHPSAARMANQLGGTHKGLAISLFSMGGNIGFVSGPLLAVLMITTFGMEGTVVYALIGVVTATALSMLVMNFKGGPRAAGKGRISPEDSSRKSNNWRQFSCIAAIITCRSAVQTSLLTYLPLYLMQNFGQEKSVAAFSVTLYSFFGVMSNLLGGFLSDRIGRARVLRAAYAPFALALPGVGLAESERMMSGSWSQSSATAPTLPTAQPLCSASSFWPATLPLRQA